MKKRYATLGIFHHDCWYTKVINKFPASPISMLSQETYDEINGKHTASGFFRMINGGNDTEHIYSMIKRHPAVLKLKKLTNEDSPLFAVTWKTDGTAYEQILGAGSDYVSPCYAKQGYETFDVIAGNVKEMKNVIKTAEDVGQLKVFRLGDSFDEQNMGLTPNQLTAVMSALNHGYYDWPKEVNLTKLAEIVGKKRRTLQENLRRAEAKLFPQAMKRILR